MFILDSVHNTKPGDVCACPLCEEQNARREFPLAGATQLYCPRCGRYAFGNVALAEGAHRGLLNNSKEFRQFLATKLSMRPNKEKIAYIMSDTYQAGELHETEE